MIKKIVLIVKEFVLVVLRVPKEERLHATWEVARICLCIAIVLCGVLLEITAYHFEQIRETANVLWHVFNQVVALACITVVIYGIAFLIIAAQLVIAACLLLVVAPLVAIYQRGVTLYKLCRSPSTVGTPELA